MLTGCASFNPPVMDEKPFRQRAVTQTEGDVRVSATVLGAQETEALFGLPLYKKEIQPVWLEIENRSAHRMWFPQVSVDRDYFAPLEVAYMHHSGFSKAGKQRMDRYFHRHAFRSPIDPGGVRSGFVFTNLRLGTKAFNVEVIGDDHRIRTFTFLIPVAGLRVDHAEVDWDGLYRAGEKVALDSLDEFKKVLEALPCCTTGADGSKKADPVNVVIVGDGNDVLYALLRSGWHETAAASSYSPTAQLPWEFRYQPVKSLYLFERAQDSAFRKSRSTLNERNQLRLWLSPFYYEGKNVWVGQISRIIRRSAWNKFVIEPDVDEARTYLLQDLWYAQAVLQYGYVKGTGVATISEPRKSLHDDNYFTDGLRIVIWVSSEPVTFTEVGFVGWETPVADRRELLLGR
ncbi:MAG: hypothetical protein AMJ54_16370 [Deltaproteobacteria bacterium SG8_13]|nr:MAG: hypothetical protein AMJ54_16370 [Deltaproteobacteria bacterium SG8_13]